MMMPPCIEWIHDGYVIRTQDEARSGCKQEQEKHNLRGTGIEVLNPTQGWALAPVADLVMVSGVGVLTVPLRDGAWAWVALTRCASLSKQVVAISRVTMADIELNTCKGDRL